MRPDYERSHCLEAMLRRNQPRKDDGRFGSRADLATRLLMPTIFVRTSLDSRHEGVRPADLRSLCQRTALSKCNKMGSQMFWFAYSITSLARRKTEGWTLMPSVVAV